MTAYISPLLSLLGMLSLLLIGRSLYRFQGIDTEDQLTSADNPAFGLSMFGYLAGLLCVLTVLIPSAQDCETPTGMLYAFIDFVIYGFLAIGLLIFSGFLNRKLILNRFDVKKELITDRNTGTGFVLAGSYLASGLVLAGAFSGELSSDALPFELDHWAHAGVELVLALMIYGFTQGIFCLYGRIYQWIQPKNRDLHDAIERDYEKDGVFHGGNAAAGLAFGGNLLALGIALFGGARPDVESITSYFIHFGLTALCACLLLPLGRLFIDRAMLAHASLTHEIYEDRNVNAALIESVSLCAIAAVLAVALIF